MKGKRISKILIIFELAFTGFFPNFALAASSAVQIIDIPLSSITAFTTSGNPSTLVIDSAFPGLQPMDEVNATTFYNVSTNESGKKITGMLNCNMPAHMFLKIRLVAPSGATSAGDVVLSTMPADLVTGISKIAESGKGITYTFSSTAAAGMITSGMRTVILTITN